jgi:CRP-like cAMP-binding protein
MYRPEPLANLLARKIAAFVRLSAEDRRALDNVWNQARKFAPIQQDVIREGDEPTCVRLLVEGWACRYKMLEDGRRQILSFFLPGDICDFNVFVLRHMDHSMLALTAVRYVTLSPADFDMLTLNNPRILQAFWWETLVNASIQREWTVNLGQRSALERMSHLLCELFIRLRLVGLTYGNRCELPVTQIELADALGLTPVHVSRTMKELRSRQFIRLKDRQLEILDFDALCQIAMFDANYLHLDREGAHLDANN